MGRADSTVPAIGPLAAALAARLALEEGLGVSHMPIPRAAAGGAAAAGETETAAPGDGAWTVPVPAPRRAPGPATIEARAPAPLPAAGIPPPPPPVEPDHPAYGRQAALARLAGQAGACQACPGLAGCRQRMVWGEGAPDAGIFFAGDAPDRESETAGRPFVGPAGRILTDMIEKVLGMPRGKAYLATLLCCHPAQHRDPRPEEMDACRPWFDGQVEAVAPRVLVALGERAGRRLAGSSEPFARLRGRWHEYRGIPLRVMHHPAYLHRIRQGRGGERGPADRHALEDLKAIRDRLG